MISIRGVIDYTFFLMILFSTIQKTLKELNLLTPENNVFQGVLIRKNLLKVLNHMVVLDDPEEVLEMDYGWWVMKRGALSPTFRITKAGNHLYSFIFESDFSFSDSVSTSTLQGFLKNARFCKIGSPKSLTE